MHTKQQVMFAKETEKRSSDSPSLKSGVCTRYSVDLVQLQYVVTQLARCFAQSHLLGVVTYNSEGSEFWLLGKAFKRRFEDKFRRIKYECTICFVLH